MRGLVHGKRHNQPHTPRDNPVVLPESCNEIPATPPGNTTVNMEYLCLSLLPVQDDTQLRAPQHPRDNTLVNMEDLALPPLTVEDATKTCALQTDLELNDSDYSPSPATSPEKVMPVLPQATRVCIDICQSMPTNNMCFEANNDCSKTVSEYANSIGLDVRPMPKIAKYKIYPYNLWAETLVPQGECVV